MRTPGSPQSAPAILDRTIRIDTRRIEHSRPHARQGRSGTCDMALAGLGVGLELASSSPLPAAVRLGVRLVVAHADSAPDPDAFVLFVSRSTRIRLFDSRMHREFASNSPLVAAPPKLNMAICSKQQVEVEAEVVYQIAAVDGDNALTDDSECCDRRDSSNGSAGSDVQ